MNNNSYSGHVPANDEIDLVELIKGLWAQKWLIVVVTLVVTLGAASYAFLSKPIYEARVAMLPPSVSDIAPFNLVRNAKTGLPPYSVDDVYTVFTRNLQSEENRRQFFNEVYLPSIGKNADLADKDSLYKKFSSEFSVKEVTKGQPNFSVSVQHHDPAEAADWVKQYIDQVARQSLSQMLQNTRSEVEVRGGQIQQEINALREFAKARREDRLVKLKEALVVAESVGLVSPPVISGQVSEQLSAFMDGDLMYMRGTKALRAEIEALETRKTDDPFIPSLRNLEEQYSYLLAGIQVAPENVAISRQDGAVVTPDVPVKPRKVLILVIGVFLGGMLGLFAALIRLVIRNYSSVARGSSLSTAWPVPTS